MDWDRVFLTSEHLNHEGRFSWKSSKPGSTFCLNCAVDILNSVNRLTVEKKHVLAEFLNQLATNRPEVADAMNGSSSHARSAIFALIDLIQHHDEELTTFAAEGFLQTMDVINSVEVTERILETVLIRVCEVRDHQLLSKTMNLLSQLLRRQPFVAQHYVTVASGSFLGFLMAALQADAAEDVKSSAVFTLVLLVKELGWTSTFDPLIGTLPNDVVSILKNTSSKELQLNCLLLVRLMSYQPTAAQALLTADADGATLPDILKRALLTRHRPLMRAAASCVATLLQCPEVPFAALLLRDDVAPFLFEGLGCVDGALVGSILRCCLIFTENEKFFTACCTVYGIDSVLRATEVSLNFQHFHCLDLAFQLLTAIFAKQPKNLPLFSSSAKVLRVLKNIERGLEIPFGTVALSAVKTLGAFLRSDHLLCPVPFSAVQEAVRCALGTVCELTDGGLSGKPGSGALTGSWKASSRFEERLAAVIRCVNALQRLYQDCSQDPTRLGSSYEVGLGVTGSGGDELDDLQRFVAQIGDEIFVPLILAHRDSLADLDVFCQFFGCLVLLLDTRNSAWTADSVTKVVTSGFLVLACDGYSAFQQDMRVERKDVYFEMRNSFLVKYLSYLVSRDWELTEDEPESVFAQFRNGVVHLHGLPRHFLAVFVGDCGATGNGNDQQAARSTLLALCYFLAFYDQSIIASDVLLPALCHLLIMRHLHLDVINLKCVLFLIAVNSVGWTESHRDIRACIPNYDQGEIQRLKSPRRIYTHHRALLKWAFSSDDVTRVIGRTVLHNCLQHSLADKRGPAGHFDLGGVMAEALDQCVTFAHVFSDALSDEDPVLANEAMKAVQMLTFEGNCGMLVAQKMPNILAVSLTNEDTSLADENLEILLKWLSGRLISADAVPHSSEADSDDVRLPLFRQVAKAATRAFGRNGSFAFSLALQCLNFLLAKFHSDGDQRGVSILLLDTHFLRTLQEALNRGSSEEEPSPFNMDALMLLATLVRIQAKFDLKFCERVVLDFSVLHRALFSSFEPPILIALQICADFIGRIDALSSFFAMEGIAKIPNFSEENSGSSTYNDDFSLLDLRTLYAILLNLLFKEFLNDKVVAATVECLQAAILAANCVDECAGGRLVSQYWTGMAVEMMLPNVDRNPAFLQFIHSVLYFSPSAIDDEIWVEIWSKNFREIIAQFEEFRSRPTPEAKIRAKLLRQMLALSEAIPDLGVDWKRVEDLVGEFESLIE